MLEYLPLKNAWLTSSRFPSTPSHTGHFFGKVRHLSLCGSHPIFRTDWSIVFFKALGPILLTWRGGNDTSWASSEPRPKKPGVPYFPWNAGCLIGILKMVYYNPNITGQYNPLYTLNNQVFFIAQVASAGRCQLHNCFKSAKRLWFILADGMFRSNFFLFRDLVRWV